MAFFKTEAVNLKVSRIGEADKLVVLFTRQYGRLSAVAKSAYKAKSKFGGRMEVLAYNSLLLAKGKSLNIISQAETLENFQKLRESEDALKASLYMSKVLYHFLEDHGRNEELFELMLDSLRMLKFGVAPSLVSRMFDVRFADTEGFLPMKDFSVKSRDCVAYLKNGAFDFRRFTGDDLTEVDAVLSYCISDHIGKDIRNWKSL